MTEPAKSKSTNPAIIIAIWSAVLVTVFVAFRSTDLLKLPSLLGYLGGGPLFGGEGILASAVGAIIAVLILVSWLGIGSFVFRYLKTERGENFSQLLELVRNIAVGAIVTSLIWFFLGLAGLYSPLAAIIITVVGFVEGGINLARGREPKTESVRSDNATGFDKALLPLAAVPVVLAFVAALAPPIAKDTLLYHFAVPKAFIAQGSNAFIDGNIASYLALGTEMHAVWAMLLGNFVSTRAGEAAAGATTFLFFPLLLGAVFGWARELSVSRSWSLVATLMVAAIPTAFHVASSGYIDLALALYITLACYSLTRWWKTLSTSSMVLVGLFLGGALAVKLTAVFVFAAFALVVLLRARDAKNPVAIAPGSDPEGVATASASSGKIVALGFGALVLAGAIASPWYLRNWAATGSPVFPFYMSVWKGTANGWDVERSNLFQGMNSQYGGADINKTNYLMSPFRVSLAAQPENPELYDGVLGAAFLIGLPLLIWAFWKKKLADEFAIAAGVAAIVYLFWLFSSPQLRYLLPIAPLLAVAIVGAIESVLEDAGSRAAAKYSLLAASVVAIFTSAAWFCQKAPLRVVLGGETRDQYLTRNLDYYPYYQTINSEADADAKVWLINMRRDTYYIDRPVVSDYLFEDWTLRKMVWESRNTAELKAKAAAMGVKYILARHDFLFDLDKSTLVDEKKPRAENEAKLRMAKELILDPANTVRADSKFSLVKVF
ncbi:MAG TPA: glycosyltransferase family 39 protein [Pyrinomonadaceae bacterium]|mgnify:CR=1 FL=1|nr:glycosyltransferase family 39 protein [Pyrinomonadaceae bacterium]